MDLSKYEELTGKTVPASQQARYKAVLKRVQSKLETLLGWSFTPQALYQEDGKSNQGCVCPNIPESLSPADEVKGIIKVFPYNYKDKFLFTDPYEEVYNVKLGKVLENKHFITYKTFDSFSKIYFTWGLGKYIERCETCFCDCDCKDCVSLIVDGDWLTGENLPDELLYLMCDMVDFYADSAKDIVSESVDGHSWSRNKESLVPYEDRDEIKAILIKYAGPFGSIVRIPTV